MENLPFKFKQFEVQHHNSTMKVGTDSVLLGGALSLRNKPKYILDIGTGCGVIALMMAQKYPDAQILGIDIDEKSVIEAQLNFDNSTWHARLAAQHISLQDYCKNRPKDAPKFGCIITNPPYFKYENPTEDNTARQNARQQATLNFEDIFACSAKMMEKSGILSMIIPCNMLEDAEITAYKHNLHIQKLIKIAPNYTTPCHLVLLDFSFDAYLFHHSGIAIRDDDGAYSERYIEATKDFYQKF